MLPRLDDPPTSASQSARITGVSHCARPNPLIFNNKETASVIKSLSSKKSPGPDELVENSTTHLKKNYYNTYPSQTSLKK
uniref:Uncharacterized protein n=1 Tax=Prolemur simus TaxID=1328070 RepID=A0A8C9AC10_PROSS